ncbi:4-amino-4-deoxychorismate lyase [Tangfeifania diversioriginum]|uniref:4-amino-4-deoxychorismate lyase n=1 Tax=Tangfeifania diversioriginum TaxID=1168035 RepID=A0A1M6G3B5_9BACT|nr:aminotransferase class IV family protein [Tangfeifania diversioriginum]SHJ04439.1 4-amino-4-deoxychorismate lyase [Tangfeifania diversioriginum]
MCQLVETIKCKNGKLENLRYHQARFNLARKELFGENFELNLIEEIKVPEKYQTGLFRCRVIYASDIEKIEFHPYEYRKVESLKLMEDCTIDYRYKFTDRKKLNELFEKRGNCDDILIVKNGCITESYVANIVFFDGKEWWTPDTPLLRGTRRAQLIEEGKIKVCRITPDDIPRFEKAGLINAMQGLNEMPEIKIENIV